MEIDSLHPILRPREKYFQPEKDNVILTNTNIALRERLGDLQDENDFLRNDVKNLNVSF